jgi:hypothetical protein
MNKIEPYNEKPERIPDEKIEIVSHQGDRLGSCFGEHTYTFGSRPNNFSFNVESVPGFDSDYSPVESFLRNTIEQSIREMADDLDKKIRSYTFNEWFKDGFK